METGSAGRPEFAITVHDDLPADEGRAVDSGLGEANERAAPLHEVRPLSCFARLPSGALVGGAVGRTWGACCELQQLWVAPGHRRRGLGARLVRAFEHRALDRGCRTFYLETFSFQAPALYRSLGYEVRLELQGFAPGIRRFTMVREVGAPQRESDPGHGGAGLGPLPPVDDVLALLHARGIEVPPGPVRVDGYGDSPELSEELLTLIRDGRKRAGTSLLWAIEADREALPEAGQVEIVLDHRQRPAILTRVISVQVLPYAEVGAEYAAIEGEGDGSLAHWRDAHWAFFARECRRIGREPHESMPVVCTVFEVLRIPPD